MESGVRTKILLDMKKYEYLQESVLWVFSTLHTMLAFSHVQLHFRPEAIRKTSEQSVLEKWARLISTG